MRLQLVLLAAATAAIVDSTSQDQKPNIIIILADDLGYNDVSWHNPEILTPNLEYLATTGVMLENAYVQPICTPTRSALMTGYYPIHTGRQVAVIKLQEPKGLYTNFTLLPEHLNRLGYDSRMVGKWHLGYCNEAYCPTSRGFSSFSGYYLGAEDYFLHSRSPSVGGGEPGYDFRRNNEVDWASNGTYSVDVFIRRAEEAIREHATKKADQPLFLYLPFQSVHSPLEVPQIYEDMYPNEHNQARKTFSGMVTAMDDAVGNITAMLKNYGLYSNSIILFSSDNGGQTQAGGNNYPLRGNKNTLWEGGTRASSFIHSPLISQQGTVYKGLIHVTDWLPTLYSAAGGQVSDLGPLDGINQWEALVSGGKSARTEMLYNIIPGKNAGRTVGAAIRIGEMKLIRGTGGYPDGWIPPEDVLNLANADDISLRNFGGCSGREDARKVQLFNLTADPTEHFDISANHPDVVSVMLLRLHELEVGMIDPDISEEVEAGNPNNFGGTFSSGWCNAEPPIPTADSAPELGMEEELIAINVI